MFFDRCGHKLIHTNFIEELKLGDQWVMFILVLQSNVKFPYQMRYRYETADMLHLYNIDLSYNQLKHIISTMIHYYKNDCDIYDYNHRLLK